MQLISLPLEIKNRFVYVHISRIYATINNAYNQSLPLAVMSQRPPRKGHPC